MYLLYITTSDKNEALKIANHLIEEELAACCNITEGAISVYKWQGSLKEEREVQLLAKTSKAKLKKAIERINQIHSYDIPCVLAIKIKKGSKDFIKWVDNL